MTDEKIRRPRRRRPASRPEEVPDTPDAIEIAMKAVASGADQHASARAVLEKHAGLLEVQTRREQEEWVLLRLQRVTRLLFIGATAALLLAVGGSLWAASQSRSLIVEPFSVPASLASRGVTGEVVAARVLDQLAHMQRVTASVRAESSYSNNWQDNVEVNVLESGFSVGEIWRALRQWLGRETRISGEIITGPDGALIMTTRAGVLSAPAVTAAEGDLDELMSKGAEGIYAVTQPYRHAFLLRDAGRPDEAEAAMLALTRAGDADERRWGYSGLSYMSRTNGDLPAAISNARLALEIDPLMVPALGNLGTAYILLGRDERALTYYQASQSSPRQNSADYSPVVLASNNAGQRIWISARLGDASGYSSAYREMATLTPERAPPHDAALAKLDVALLTHDWAPARSAISGLSVSESDRIQYELTKAWSAVVAALDLEDASTTAPTAQAFSAALHAYGESLETPAEPGSQGDLEVRTNYYPSIAHALALGGEADEALALIALTPLDCYDCVLARGHVAVQAGNRRAAEHWWRETIRIGPSIPMGYHALGRSRLEAGDAAGALALFLAAQDKGPRWADPVKGEADALIALGRTRQGLRRYAVAAERAPRWGALHLAWGGALEADGRRDAAARRYSAALGMDLSQANRAEAARRLAVVARA